MESTTQTSRTTVAMLKEKPQLFFIIPGVFVALSILALFVWGLKPGIDLAGGSMLQVAYEAYPAVEEVNKAVAELSYGEIRVQEAGEGGFILRQRELLAEEKMALMEALGTLGAVEEVQFNSIGPSIGSELAHKAWWAVAMVSLAMILFIAFAFRHVSDEEEEKKTGVSSWNYGIVAVVTLLHDVLIPTGLFAYLGYVRGVEVGVLFIVAILATLGVSINDTIVIFDRIRENLHINKEKKNHQRFVDIVWDSVMQTLARSFNTTITVVIMLVALFILGPESTKDFSLVLIVGMIAGTYSSVLLASPMLVFIEKRQKNKTKKVT